MEGDDKFMVFVYCIGAMILVNRHTEAGGAPFRATLRIMPVSSVVLFDVRSRLREEFGSDFTRYSKEFYISDHTTAGYLDQRLVELLEHDNDNIQDYLKVFPPDAGYIHDELNLRTSPTSNAPPNRVTPTPTSRSWVADCGTVRRTNCGETGRCGSWSWTASTRAA